MCFKCVTGQTRKDTYISTRYIVAALVSLRQGSAEEIGISVGSISVGFSVFPFALWARYQTERAVRKGKKGEFVFGEKVKERQRVSATSAAADRWMRTAARKGARGRVR